MKVGYVRVSSTDQNEARQVESLNKFGVERLFIDKMSGKNMERPNLKLMMDFIREGDVVYVHELSRLGRSLRDLLKITDMLQDKKVELVVVDQNIDTTTPAGQLLFVVMAAIAEFERKTIKERQREGLNWQSAEVCTRVVRNVRFRLILISIIGCGWFGMLPVPSWQRHLEFLVRSYFG